MLTMTIAAQEPSRGWGGPIALLIAAAVFFAFTGLLDHLQQRRDAHSPTEGDDPGVRVKPQVGPVSDTGDTRADTVYPWGRISHDDRADDAIDLALDDGAGTLEEAIARMDGEGVPYAEIVREAMAAYGVSESTAKRRIRDVRSSREAA